MADIDEKRYQQHHYDDYAKLNGFYNDEEYNNSYINGLSTKYVKDYKNYKSALISVPTEVSSNGRALITFKNYNEAVKGKGYVNLRFPQNYEIKTICKDADNKDVIYHMTADQLNECRSAAKNKTDEVLKSVTFDFADESKIKCRFDFDDYSRQYDLKDLNTALEYLQVRNSAKNLITDDTMIFARVNKAYCTKDFRDKMSFYSGDNYCFELGMLKDTFNKGCGLNVNIPFDEKYNHFNSILGTATDSLTLSLTNHYERNLPRNDKEGDWTITESHSDVAAAYRIPSVLATAGVGMRFETREDADMQARSSMSDLALAMNDKEKVEPTETSRYGKMPIEYFLVHISDRDSYVLCAGPKGASEGLDGRRLPSVGGVPMYEGFVGMTKRHFGGFGLGDTVCIAKENKNGETTLEPIDAVPLVQQSVVKDEGKFLELEHSLLQKLPLVVRQAEVENKKKNAPDIKPWVRELSVGVDSEVKPTKQKKRRLPDRTYEPGVETPELEL